MTAEDMAFRNRLLALVAEEGTPLTPAVNRKVCELIAAVRNQHPAAVEESERDESSFPRDWREYDPDQKWVVARRGPSWEAPRPDQYLLPGGGWTEDKAAAATFTGDEARKAMHANFPHTFITFAS